MVTYTNVTELPDGSLTGTAVYLDGHQLPFYAAPRSLLYEAVADALGRPAAVAVDELLSQAAPEGEP